MKTRLSILFLAVPFLSGCYLNMHLYPAQGPLAAQTPLPVFTAKITGRSSGDVTLPFVAGEVCKGPWTRVTPTKGPAGAQTVNVSGRPDIATVWDSVYGPGFYTAHVLGTWMHGTAALTCDRGSTLDLEFISGGGDQEHPGSTRGVARDNQGNIYKIVL